MTFFLGSCMQNIIEHSHPEWHELLRFALSVMDANYLDTLQASDQWLPGIDSLFAAFSLPLSATNYILLGESPYPRKQSANGYAFWDNAVLELWSSTGLDKQVNRATTLRNLLKMFLFARGDLTDDLSQGAIANLDKSNYVQTAEQLFKAFMQKGFLLLNASLVYAEGEVQYHARQWRPFIQCLLTALGQSKPSLKLVLFGNIAKQIPQTNLNPALVVEHPYNISFITNPRVIAFFKPLDLLARGTIHE